MWGGREGGEGVGGDEGKGFSMIDGCGWLVNLKVEVDGVDVDKLMQSSWVCVFSSRHWRWETRRLDTRMRLCSRRRPSRSPRPRRALPSDPLPSTTKKQALEEKEGEEEEEEEEVVVGKEVFLLLPGHSPRGRGLPQGRVSILAHTTSTPTTLPTLPYVVMCVVE